MADNKMEQVAQMFGKKLNEEFRITRVVRFGANGLEVPSSGWTPSGWIEEEDGLLEKLLSGEAEIVEE